MCGCNVTELGLVVSLEKRAHYHVTRKRNTMTCYIDKYIPPQLLHLVLKDRYRWQVAAPNKTKKATSASNECWRGLQLCGSLALCPIACVVLPGEHPFLCECAHRRGDVVRNLWRGRTDRAHRPDDVEMLG